MSILNKIIFNNEFSDIKNNGSLLSFKFKEKKFVFENDYLTPYDAELINILGVKQPEPEIKNEIKKDVIVQERTILEPEIKPKDIKLYVTEDGEHPYNNIIKEGKPLSWTGSAGVEKFTSCPRKAFLSSRRQRKVFSANSQASMDLGTLLHEYTLRDNFFPSSEREMLEYYFYVHTIIYPKHGLMDVVGMVRKAREQIFGIFEESLGKDYTARFEEQYIARYHDLNFIQYVDAYAFSVTKDKIKVVIVDLKTSSRKGVKEMAYWGQLLYYRYNLRKKLSEEFKIKEENIEFETHIEWIFYKACKKIDYKLRQLVKPNGEKPKLTTPLDKKIPIDKIIRNSKFILPLITHIAYEDTITSVHQMTPIKVKDDTLITHNEVKLTMEHEEYLKEEILKASKIIYKGDLNPNYHACNKNAWGCDYEAVCHLNTKLSKKQYKNKDDMLDTVFEDINEELIKVVIPDWKIN